MLLNGIMAFEPLVTCELPVYTAHGRCQYTQMLLPWALYRASGDSGAFKELDWINFRADFFFVLEEKLRLGRVPASAERRRTKEKDAEQYLFFAKPHFQTKFS